MFTMHTSCTMQLLTQGMLMHQQDWDNSQNQAHRNCKAMDWIHAVGSTPHKYHACGLKYLLMGVCMRRLIFHSLYTIFRVCT